MDINGHRAPYECKDSPGTLVWFAIRETRLAAIVQSLTATAFAEKRPSLQLQWQTVELHWFDLRRCDPVTAAYVWQELAAATEFDDAGRLAVVAADRITFRLVVDLTPEAPHAP